MTAKFDYQDLLFISLLLFGVAFASATLGREVVFWFLVLVLIGVVFARWPKIEAFMEGVLR